MVRLEPKPSKLPPEIPFLKSRMVGEEGAVATVWLHEKLGARLFICHPKSVPTQLTAYLTATVPWVILGLWWWACRKLLMHSKQT
jgi:hypothetical protein